MSGQRTPYSRRAELALVLLLVVFAVGVAGTALVLAVVGAVEATR